MDVYRGEDGSYHVEADLPGADPDSVEVTVEHGVLTIQAGRTPHYGDSGQVIVAERPQGSFARQLSLGEGVDSENLTAGAAPRRTERRRIGAPPHGAAVTRGDQRQTCRMTVIAARSGCSGAGSAVLCECVWERWPPVGAAISVRTAAHTTRTSTRRH